MSLFIRDKKVKLTMKEYFVIGKIYNTEASLQKIIKNFEDQLKFFKAIIRNISSYLEVLQAPSNYARDVIIKAKNEYRIYNKRFQIIVKNMKEGIKAISLIIEKFEITTGKKNTEFTSALRSLLVETMKIIEEAKKLPNLNIGLEFS